MAKYTHEHGSIPELLRRRAREVPDKVFLTMDDASLSYGELDRSSRAFAGALALSGIGANDRVGIMLDNSLEFFSCWFGTLRLGAIEVPLNTSLRGKHLEYIIGNCGMTLLITSQAYLLRFQDIALPESLKQIVVLTTGEASVNRLAIGFGGCSLVALSAFLKEGEMIAMEDAPLTIASPAAIIYTSGTTGPSKGVVCPHGHLLALGAETLELLEVGLQDVIYDAHPLYHAHSQGQAVMAAMIADIRLVMRKSFSASRFIGDMVDYGVTTAFLIGAAGLVLKQPKSEEDKQHRLRVINAVPVPKELHRQLEERFGVPVVEIYGMSEMGVITCSPIAARVTGSCGVASPYREVSIVDEMDRQVAVGEVGQVVVRPRVPWVTFLEYWGMPEKSLEAFRNMWFHTGDSGRLDAKGYLHFIGRIKDSIRRRGENISAFEVEQVINAHPAVLESAVLAYPSPVGEDDVWVVVVRVPQTELTAVELLAYCETALPRFAVPRYIQFEEQLPKTPTERIEKYKLSARGLASDSFDRENEARRSR